MKKKQLIRRDFALLRGAKEEKEKKKNILNEQKTEHS